MPDPTPAQVTQILNRLAAGDDRLAANELMPIVYNELRRLAESAMAHEAPGLTIQPTALVHEAYMRLIGAESGDLLKWDSRGHFFSAAAISMRRILVDEARRRRRLKRGGSFKRVALTESGAVVEQSGGSMDLVDLDEALSRLQREDPRRGEVIMLRYFAGLTIEQTASALGISETTVKADWNFARAWLRRAMDQARDDEDSDTSNASSQND